MAQEKPLNSAPASTTKNLKPSYASMRVHCSTGIGHRRRVLERRETGELLRRRHCAAHPRYWAAARLERVLSKRIGGLMHLSPCVRGASQPAYLEYKLQQEWYCVTAVLLSLRVSAVLLRVQVGGAVVV